MNLRDHDQPCGHVAGAVRKVWNQSTERKELWICSEPRCPGGAAVTLDRNGAAVQLAIMLGHTLVNVIDPKAAPNTRRIADAVIDAALGISDG